MPLTPEAITKIESLVTNAEANLKIYGTTIQGGVELPFSLPPCLDQALKDVRDVLEILHPK